MSAKGLLVMKRLLCCSLLLSLCCNLRAQPAALVLRFDDNKPVSQWREVAEIFEAAGGRCSFAVNAAWLNAEQWEELRNLSARGHEIMDHTAQHALFKIAVPSEGALAKYRTADFFDHAEQNGRLVLCRPELDLSYEGNVRVVACMTNGICRSDDPEFVKAQRFSQKFYVPSTGGFYGFGRDCGFREFKKGPEQRCSDFWGRWTTNSFPACEIILLADEAAQPSKDLLRVQAGNVAALFSAHGLPPPKTWICPGGWESGVDWRRMKAVYGDEFGYAVADYTCGPGLKAHSPWCYRSDYGFFDYGASVDTVYGRAVAALSQGHSFAYISHQLTKDRAVYLERCRSLAAKLKENGVPMTTYSHIAEEVTATNAPVNLMLTFDDWLDDHYAIVVPALEKRGWRGVFSVVPAWVGGPEAKGWERLREIVRRGHVVANHTYSHQCLGRLCAQGKRETVRAEIVQGRDILEKMTGTRPKLLCLPGCDYVPEVDKIAREEGQVVMPVGRSFYGEWEKNVTREIDALYAKGVRRADFAVHGIRPQGGGWKPFPSEKAFLDYLDAIKAAERAGKIRIVTDLSE